MFDPLQGDSTRRRYGDCGTDLVMFVIGACTDRLGKLHVETTDHQKALVKRLVGRLERGDGSEESSLQDLLRVIFTEYMANRPPYALLVYRFLILYSFRRDGSLQPCNNITQTTSMLVFFGRGSILIQIMFLMDLHRQGFYL